MAKTIVITGGCGFIGHHFVEHVVLSTDWGVGLRHEGIREHILGKRLSDSEGVERMLRHLE